MIEQVDFIWIARRNGFADIASYATGVVSVNIQSLLMIDHDYKKQNEMTLTFIESKDTYIIKTKHELEHIYYLIKNNEDHIVSTLHEHCEKNLLKKDSTS